MSTGTLWASCNSSASSLSSAKPKSRPPPPPPQGSHPHFPQKTGRPDHASGLPSKSREFCDLSLEQEQTLSHIPGSEVTGRVAQANATDGVAKLRRPLHTVIPNGAGPLRLPLSLLRTRPPAQRGIPLPFSPRTLSPGSPHAWVHTETEARRR